MTEFDRFWWKATTLLDSELTYEKHIVNFTQGSNPNEKDCIRLQARIDNPDKLEDTLFVGPLQSLRWLASHLHLNYRKRPTTATNLLCGIHALKISVQPIYLLYGKKPPSFDRILSIFQSYGYRKATRDRYETAGLLGETAMETIKDDLESNTLTIGAVQLLLRILCEEDDIRIAMGTLTNSRDCFRKPYYSVYIENIFLAEGQNMIQEDDYDGIAWFINDNALNLRANRLSHWSGMAPFSSHKNITAWMNHEATSRKLLEMRTAQFRIANVPDSLVLDAGKSAQAVRGSGSQRVRDACFGDADEVESSATVLSRKQSENGRIVSTPMTPSNPYSEWAETTAEDRRRSSARRKLCDMKLGSEDENEGSDMKRVRLVDRGVGCPPITEPSRKRLLRSILKKYGPPRLTQLDTDNGSDYHAREMDVDEQDYTYSTQMVYLYSDIEFGHKPAGHVNIDHENDPYQVPMSLETYTKEHKRAQELSIKMILNAPPSDQDLPWDEMKGITIEELVMYFPNHVANWPGLALWLRCRNWSRLFYRTARMINVIRGTHCPDHRDLMHTEIAPLMMKMESAIRQYDSNYNIADPINLEQHTIREYIYDKPKNFPKEAKMAKLREASSYVTGYGLNEFSERPFSKKMMAMFNYSAPHQNVQNPSQTPVTPRKFPLKIMDEDKERLQSLENTLGWHHLSDNSNNVTASYHGNSFCSQGILKPEKEDSQHTKDADEIAVPANLPLACEEGDRCEELGCPYLHTQDINGMDPAQKQIATQYPEQVNEHRPHQSSHQDQPRQSNPLHPPDNGKNSNTSTSHQNTQLCKFNSKCIRADCHFAHCSPAASSDTEVNLEQWCKFSRNCRSANCTKSHGSPASGQTDGAGRGGRGGNRNSVMMKVDKGGNGQHKRGDDEFRGRGHGRGQDTHRGGRYSKGRVESQGDDRYAGRGVKRGNRRGGRGGSRGGGREGGSSAAKITAGDADRS